MRLWHTSLIKILPCEQLVAQWREISACVGSIQKKGTPNHILVNFIMDYDFDHLISYAYYVRKEMTQRDYRTMNSVWEKIISLKPDYAMLHQSEVYPYQFNQTYKEICFYNLLEKYMCGGIKEEDWTKLQTWAVQEGIIK